MSGLISLLIFAAFFFLMMRFGCGAHAGHGGHHHGRHRGESSSRIDPVCGMQVEPDQGYAKAYAGTRYHFCSRDCLDKFDAAPGNYIGGEHNAHPHAGHHS